MTAFFAGLWSPTFATAQEPSAPAAPPSLVVLLASRQTETQAALVIAGIQAQLVDLEVAARTVWVDEFALDLGSQLRLAKDFAPLPSTLTVVWFQVEPDGTSLLYVFLPRSERLLVRGFAPSQLGPLSEAIGVVVRASVAALLLHGEDVELDLEPKPQPAPPPVVAVEPAAPPSPPMPPAPQPPAAPRDSLVSVLSEYQVEPYDDALWNHGLYLGVRLRPWRHVATHLGYNVMLSELRVGVPQVRLNAERHPIWLGLQGLVPLGQRFLLGAGLFGVADIVTHRTATSGRASATSGDSVALDIWMAMSLELSFQIIRELELVAGLGAQLGLRRSSYRVSTPDGEVDLLTPWLWRPLGQVGVRLHLW